MIPIIGTGIAALAGKFLADKILYYVAIKALIVVALTVTLPIILKNLITWLFSSIMEITQANLPDSSTLQSFVLQFEGVGGFFATHLRIPEAVSVVITALTIRLVLNLIPMVR